MEILHVVPTLSMLDGGTTVSVIDMVTGLEALGVRVLVATTTGHGNTDLDVEDGHISNVAGARVIYFSRRSPKNWKYSPAMAAWLKDNIRKFDLVHTHSLFCYPEIPAISAAKKHGVPVVLSPAGMHDAWSLSHHRWKKWPYYQLIEKRNLGRVDALHVTAESERDGFTGTGFKDKAVVIPLGVRLLDISHNFAEDSTARPLRLLFMARLHPKKALPIVLKAMSILAPKAADVTLTVAGDGAPDYVAEMITLATELGVKERVRFVGFVEGTAKHNLLSDSDVYVLPSYQENFGISVVEAMGYGLPVIISNQVGVHKQVAAAKAGIVIETDSPQQLAEAVDRLQDIGRRRILSTSGRALVKNDYSNISQAQKVLAMYQRVIKLARAC